MSSAPLIKILKYLPDHLRNYIILELNPKYIQRIRKFYPLNSEIENKYSNKWFSTFLSVMKEESVETLSESLEDGSYELFDQLFEEWISNKNFNERTLKRTTTMNILNNLLAAAILNKNLEYIKRFISLGADYNHGLVAAANYGDFEIFDWLRKLDNKALDPKVYRSLLKNSAIGGNLKIFNQIAADFNINNIDTLRDAFTMAADHGNLDIFNRIAEFKLDKINLISNHESYKTWDKKYSTWRTIKSGADQKKEAKEIETKNIRYNYIRGINKVAQSGNLDLFDKWYQWGKDNLYPLSTGEHLTTDEYRKLFFLAVQGGNLNLWKRISSLAQNVLTKDDYIKAFMEASMGGIYNLWEEIYSQVQNDLTKDDFIGGLEKALIFNNLKIVQRLMSQENNDLINDFDQKDYLKLLLPAVRLGDLEIFDQIFGFVKNLEGKDDYINALRLALHTKNIEIYQRMMDSMTNNPLTKEDYVVAIMMEAENEENDLEQMEIAFQLGKDFLEKDDYVELLESSLNGNNLKITQRLMSEVKNSFINSFDREDYLKLLLPAVGLGNLEIFNQISEFGKDFLMENDYIDALRFALKSKNIEIYQKIIDLTGNNILTKKDYVDAIIRDLDLGNDLEQIKITLQLGNDFFEKDDYIELLDKVSVFENEELNHFLQKIIDSL